MIRAMVASDKNLHLVFVGTQKQREQLGRDLKWDSDANLADLESNLLPDGFIEDSVALWGGQFIEDTQQSMGWAFMSYAVRSWLDDIFHDGVAIWKYIPIEL